MHSSRMRTTHSLLYGEVSLTETSRTETLQGQRPPRQSSLDTDPPGQRPPRDRDPPDRDPCSEIPPNHKAMECMVRTRKTTSQEMSILCSIKKKST